MKKIIWAIPLFAIFLLLTGCVEKTDNINKTKSIETIKIGMIAPIGSVASAYGEDAVNVKLDAIEQFNTENPNINIDLIVENGNCDGKDAASAAQKLINVDKVPIILGGSCSSETLAAGKLANDNKVVLLSASASAPAISDIGIYVFRFRNDIHAAKKLGEYVSDHNQNIAMIYEKTDYAQALATEFEHNFQGKVVTNKSYQSAEKDFDILVNQVAKYHDQVDGIVIFAQDEANTASIIKAMDKYGILEKFKDNIYSAYWFSSNLFLEQAGELADGLIEINADTNISNQKGIDFLADFKTKYEVKSLNLIVIAEKESIDLTLRCIKDGSRTSEEFKSCFKSITKRKPYIGHFGEYYFDEKGDAIGLGMALQKIENGEVTRIN